MPSPNISNEIREKREALGITTKEFADALGLNKNGEKLLREWEKGTAVPAEDIYQKITFSGPNFVFEEQKNYI